MTFSMSLLCSWTFSCPGENRTGVAGGLGAEAAIFAKINMTPWVFLPRKVFVLLITPHNQASMVWILWRFVEDLPKSECKSENLAAGLISFLESCSHLNFTFVRKIQVVVIWFFLKKCFFFHKKYVTFKECCLSFDHSKIFTMKFVQPLPKRAS